MKPALTYDQISNPLAEIFPNASRSFLKLNGKAPDSLSSNHGQIPRARGLMAPAVSHTESQPDLRLPLESGHALPSACPGGVTRLGDIVQPRVTITLYRVRLLDTDNKWASVKPLLDALRYAGLIPNDRECDIQLSVQQIKVAKYSMEGTGVVIQRPTLATASSSETGSSSPKPDAER